MKNYKRLGLLLMCLSGLAVAVPASAESGAAPSYTLTADDADLDLAPDVIREGDPTNLGGWANGNSVGFYFVVDEAGLYTVSVEYSKEDAYEPYALVRLETGETDLDNVMFPATGSDWSVYETLTLDEPMMFYDSGYLWIEPGSSQSDSHLINLRSVTITREGDTDEDSSSDDPIKILYYDASLFPLMFTGSSQWSEFCEYNESEDITEYCADLLYGFELLGADTSAASGEELADFIAEAYDIGYSMSIFDLAAYYLDMDPTVYREEVLTILNQTLTDKVDEYEEFQYFLDGRLPDAAMTFKDDWYGDTTDDERIALADAVLYLFQVAEFETGDYNGNTLAQAINDLYDQDAGDSMLSLAVSVCGIDSTAVYDLIDCLDDIMYEYYYDTYES